MSRKRMVKVGMVGGIILFLLTFFYWQNNDIVISEYIYKNNKISTERNGYKIAQISDLHNKSFGKNQKKIIRLLEKQSPNMIVVTGDVVDSSRTDIDVAIEFVEQAMKIAPVYYVTGNHEHLLSENDWATLMNGLKQVGVKILDNQTVEVANDLDDGFTLMGLNDNSLQDNTLNIMTSSTFSTNLTILLAHEPQYFDQYSKEEVDLVLAGHAHGGQFRIPSLGGMIAPGQGFFPKYTSGIHVQNQTSMIISRGLGNSTIPFRIFNRPEIVIVELRNHSSES